MKLEQMERAYDLMFAEKSEEPLVQSTKDLMRSGYNNGLREGEEKGFSRGVLIGGLLAASGTFLGSVIRKLYDSKK